MNLWNKLQIWLYELHERKYRKIDDTFYDVKLSPELVAERFKLLLQLHGVEVTEIPELKEFEDITLYDLNLNDRLLQKLSPSRLEKIASYFGVRIEWLRSGDARMYSHRHWYKESLVKFFDDLKDVDFEKTYDPFYIITTTKEFDVNSDEYQPFILVLRKYIDKVDEDEVYRYYFESVWDWHHSPCRLQAKALATRYYELTGRMITIYQASKENFYKIQQGYIPPRTGVRNFNVSFEEYGALKFPHLDEPYEGFEYDRVLKSIKSHELDKIKHNYLNFSDVTDNAEQSSQSENLQRKAALAKHEPVYELKRKCIVYWLETNKKFSYQETAKRFFYQLPRDERVLSETGGIDTLAEAISQYCRREELSAKGEFPIWLVGFNPEK